MTSISEKKSNLRKNAEALLSRLSTEQMRLGSEGIRRRLKNSEVWQSSKSVLFYSPIKFEVDIWPLLEEAIHEKAVYLPGFDTTFRSYSPRRLWTLNSVVSGQFGIREPARRDDEPHVNRLDLILVPGLAFDSCARRLGRGRGFYDRLLSNTGGTRCGVCFDEQLVDEVPMEAHDMILDYLVTPTRWLKA